MDSEAQKDSELKQDEQRRQQRQQAMSADCYPAVGVARQDNPWHDYGYRPYKPFQPGFYFDSQSSTSQSSEASSMSGGHLPQWLERDLELTESCNSYVRASSPENDRIPPDATVRPPAVQHNQSLATTIDEQNTEIQKLRQELDFATRKIHQMEMDGNRKSIPWPNAKSPYTSEIGPTTKCDSVEPTPTPSLDSNVSNPAPTPTLPFYPIYKPSKYQWPAPASYQTQSNPLHPVSRNTIWDTTVDGLPKKPANPLRPEFDNSWIPIESAYRSTPFIPVMTAPQIEVPKPLSAKSVNTLDEKEKNSPSAPIPVAGASEVSPIHTTEALSKSRSQLMAIHGEADPCG
jgi:hypothetical protein